ncbi:MAG: NAD(P)-dependent oxidoreductase [Pseudomonadales bacterium]|jgi:3-hydroxyisobutyrate dehydrogenase-like beta-hydroxyacid dehydrogenase
MNIGFIGLGNMGSGMASNLQNYCAAQGHQLTVLDLDAAKVKTLTDLGAAAGTNVSTIAKTSDLLFTSLPSSIEINRLAFGEQGILTNLKHGAIWIETSTNELVEWQTVCANAPSHLTLIDGPVTGGAEGAAAGTLTMLLGIEQPQLDALAKLLSSFTNIALRMGPSGAGYVTKLTQLHLNYLVAQGIGEAMMMAAKANIDLTILHQVLQHSCAQSYVADRYMPKVLDGSYDPSFTLGLAEKDMRLITQQGQHLGVNLHLGQKVYQTYQQASQKYGADQPHLSVLKLIEDESGQQLRG